MNTREIATKHRMEHTAADEKSTADTLKENFIQEVIGISAFMAVSLQVKLSVAHKLLHGNVYPSYPPSR